MFRIRIRWAVRAIRNGSTSANPELRADALRLDQVVLPSTDTFVEIRCPPMIPVRPAAVAASVDRWSVGWIPRRGNRITTTMPCPRTTSGDSPEPDRPRAQPALVHLAGQYVGLRGQRVLEHALSGPPGQAGHHQTGHQYGDPGHRHADQHYPGRQRPPPDLSSSVEVGGVPDAAHSADGAGRAELGAELSDVYVDRARAGRALVSPDRS